MCSPSNFHEAHLTWTRNAPEACSTWTHDDAPEAYSTWTQRPSEACSTWTHDDAPEAHLTWTRDAAPISQTAREHITQLTIQLNEWLKSQNKRLTSQNKRLASQNKRLASQNKRLKIQIDRLTSQNQLLKGNQLAERNARLESDKAALIKKVENIRKSVDLLTRNNKHLTRDNKHLERQLKRNRALVNNCECVECLSKRVIEKQLSLASKPQSSKAQRDHVRGGASLDGRTHHVMTPITQSEERHSGGSGESAFPQRRHLPPLGYFSLDEGGGN